MIDEQRLPPNNREAEAAVNGSLLIDPDAIIYVSDFLKPEHFYTKLYGLIYGVMLDMHTENRPVDTLLLIERMKSKHDIDCPAEIVGLASVVPTSINVEDYGRIVRRHSKAREVLGIAEALLQVAHNGELSEEEIVAAPLALALKFSEDDTGGDFRHVSEFSDIYTNELETRYNEGGGLAGMTTGFIDLDNQLGGYKPGKFTIIAARPGMGKSALVNGSATPQAKQGLKVGVFNLEMSGEEITERFLSSMAGIDNRQLQEAQLSEAEWSEYYQAKAEMDKMSIYIDDTPTLSPSQIMSRALRMKAKHGLDIIYIDYLQLIQPDNPSGNRTQDVGSISRALKLMSRSVCPVVALAQLNRGVESRVDKRPMPSDLRDSGEMEQDADNIIFIYRDEYYNPDTTDAPNVAEIIVAKQRQGGKTGTVKLHWDGRYTRFSNLKTEEINL